MTDDTAESHVPAERRAVVITLSVSISPEAEAKLRERAAASGQPPDVYAARVLEAAVTTPSVEELLAPARQQIAAGGMTDAQLDEFLEGLRDDAWRERRPQRP